MSLLLNLISYSSNNSSSLLSQDEDRSKSVLCRHPTENRLEKQSLEKSKQASKSLSKLGFSISDQNAPKIDPKVRILHRLSQQMNRKVRKHYYAFFVILETIKKKNISLNESGDFHNGEISGDSHKKTKTKEKENLQKFMNRIQSILDVNFLREFQTKLKMQCFKAISGYSQQRQKTEGVIELLSRIRNKSLLFSSLKQMKRQNQIMAKAELFSEQLEQILQQKRSQLCQTIDRALFLRIIKSMRKSSLHKQTRMGNQTENSPTRTVLKETAKNQKSSCKTIKKNLMSEFQRASKSSVQNVRISPLKLTIQSMSEQKVSLQRQSGVNRSFQKSYCVRTSLEEQVMNQGTQTVEFNENEQISQFLRKQPINNLCPSNNDLFDKEIFRKNPQQQNMFSEQRQKAKSGLRSGRFSWRNDQKSTQNSGDMTKPNIEKHFELELSNVSSIPILRHEPSGDLTSLSNSRSNSSFFGGDAVLFKNSLVREREDVINKEKEQESVEAVNQFKKKNKPSEESFQVPQRQITQVMGHEYNSMFPAGFKSIHELSQSAPRHQHDFSQTYQSLQATQAMELINQTNVNDLSTNQNSWLASKSFLRPYERIYDPFQTKPTRDTQPGNCQKLHNSKSFSEGNRDSGLKLKKNEPNSLKHKNYLTLTHRPE